MSRSFSIGSVLLILTIGFINFANAQTPNWRVEFLGPIAPEWSSLTWAVAVNNSGQVVGNTYISGWKRGWFAEPGKGVQLLPVPDGVQFAEANDINSSGVIAGRLLTAAGSSRAVIWQPGDSGFTPMLLEAGPGGHVPFDAQGLNDAGEVVGKYGVLGGSYVWSADNGITQITTATFPKVPIDINVQRQIVGGNMRLDLDTLELEDLGNPTGTSYGFLYTEFLCLNDIGEAAGYSVTATSQNTKYLAVRYTDGPNGPEWRLFNSFPWTSASALSMSAAGDTVFQLGATFGTFVYVEGFGSISIEDLPAPDYANWDLSDSFPPAISPNGLVACTGVDDAAGDGGIVLLTPSGFDDLGGAIPGLLGDPILSGYGSTVPGEPVRVRLANAAPNSLGYFAVWTGKDLGVPGLGLTKFRTDSLGRAEQTFDWPMIKPGTEYTLQARIFDQDEGAAAFSNFLQGVTQ